MIDQLAPVAVMTDCMIDQLAPVAVMTDCMIDQLAPVAVMPHDTLTDCMETSLLHQPPSCQMSH